MEHTIMASYVCILIGHLVMHDDGHRRKMSAYLRPDGGGFAFMAKILEKYYNFMNLTASVSAGDRDEGGMPITNYVKLSISG